MNRGRLSRGRSIQARPLFISVVSLCVLLAAGSLSVGAAYDPTRPISDRHPQPGSGGGGGGGGDPTPTQKVALGVATPGGRSLDELDAFTGSIDGHTPAIWVIWSEWGLPGSRSFPTAMADGLRSRGVTPMIWWNPVDPRDIDSPTYARYSNITRGDHDAYIRQWAQDARAFGGTVLLRFAQEMNGGYFPWSIEKFDNSAETFIAAWRHVHGILQSEGATNVKMVWSVATKSCPGGCNPYTAVYPGDPYVDVMGFSGYNWGTFEGKSWKSMYEAYRAAAGQLREISGKPIMVAETGSNSEGGDKAAWIRDGYREVYDKLPDIEAIVYLNADLRDVGHPDWRIASPPAALAAYAQVAAMKEFSGTWPLTARQDKRVRAGDARKAAATHKGAKAQTEQEAPGKRKPSVRNGAAGQDDPKPDARSVSNPNRSSKRKKDDDDPPPAPLDTFSR